MLAEGLAAARNGDDVLDDLGQLPLQIRREGDASPEADHPDLPRRENRLGSGADLGLADRTEGFLDIGDALGKIGGDRLLAGRIGRGEEQARAALPVEPGVPASLLVTLIAQPLDEAGDRRFRDMGQRRQFLRRIGRDLAGKVANEIAETPLGRREIGQDAADAAQKRRFLGVHYRDRGIGGNATSSVMARFASCFPASVHADTVHPHELANEKDSFGRLDAVSV
ncbi:conserved hypothetical protein [Bosea sp. EC-HK365B]|nr:conserved hypothetical protein [Bosea sp. 7B]VVT56449.1 conserved hypothetical protein [Bosea sp. EC-HK365B]VXC91196.1 conserved hypothetical protein [Bosea sp. 127]